MRQRERIKRPTVDAHTDAQQRKHPDMSPSTTHTPATETPSQSIITLQEVGETFRGYTGSQRWEEGRRHGHGEKQNRSNSGALEGCERRRKRG